MILLANIPAQAESWLHWQEQAVGDIALHVISNKTEYVRFKREGVISTINVGASEISREVQIP